jgi:hypothetical protein
MTDREDWWQQQNPQQDYGQYPQEPSWQRQQYDPAAHRQRMQSPQQPPWPQQAQTPLQGESGQRQGYGQPSYPPAQGYGQQPAWGEPSQRAYPPQQPSPLQSPPGRRRQPSWPAQHKLLTGILALAAVVVIAVAAVALGGTSKPSAAAAAAAKTETCKQQYAVWKTGPAKAGADKIVADLGKLQSAANAEDIPETDADLKAAGDDANALKAYPMPACADPAGYWPQVLTDIKAGGDNVGSASGLGGMILAMAPLKMVQQLETKLGAELKRTTAH